MPDILFERKVTGKSKKPAELVKEIPFASRPVFLNHGNTPIKIVDLSKPIKTIYPLV
jgi:hypothetical protein